MRVWVAGLTIGGAVNKAQNSTVSAFLYAVSGTSDLLVVPSQYFYSHKLRHLHLQPDPGKPELRDLLLDRTDMQIVFHLVKGALLPKLLAFHGVGEGFADGCGVLMIIILV